MYIMKSTFSVVTGETGDRLWISIGWKLLINFVTLQKVLNSLEFIRIFMYNKLLEELLISLIFTNN